MSNADQWAHLAAWWAANGRRYNLSELALAVGKSKSAISTLLRNPQTTAYAATPSLLARLSAELQKGYTPPVSAATPAA